MSREGAPGVHGAPVTPGVNGRAAGTAPTGRARKPTFLMEQLLPEAAAYQPLPGGRRISVWSIDANPDQPRSELTGIEELAGSIVEYGLLQPVVVTPAVNGRHTLIAGHRRLAAYRYLAEHHDDPLRWSEIDAIERDGHSDERLVLALLENLSRQDLPEADIVKGLHLLHDLRKWHQSEIARRLGVSRQWISQYFRVATDPVLSEHVQTRQLTVTKAYDIQLARDETAREAALEAALQGASRALVRRIAKRGPGAVDVTDGPPTGQAAEPGGSSGAGPDAAPESEAQYGRQGPADTGAAGHGGATSSPEAGAPSADRHVASAVPDARVGNLAEVADVLDLTMRFDELELTNLIRDAVQHGAEEFRVGDFLRLVRNDVRRLEGLIRAHRPAGAPRAV